MADLPQNVTFIPPARRGRPSVFRDEFYDWVLEAGAKGCSIKGMWAYIVQEKGVYLPLDTFEGWLKPKSQGYRPEFAAAVKEGQALAQKRFEDIGEQASAGLIPKHSSGTYQFIVKNRFRSDYKDEVHQTIDKKTSIKIDPSAPPQLAAKQYQDLVLLNSGLDETFEDFFGEDT